MTIVSEIAEAMQADRSNLPDKHLPQRRGIEVQLADAMIRTAGLAGELDLDLAGVIVDKMEYNRHRKDHSPEERARPKGKKY